MSLSRHAIIQLTLAAERFERSTSILPESLSTYTPDPAMMTAAQHVAHVARVLDWFLEGAFRPECFDLDFEPQIASVLAITSLSRARKWFSESLENATARLENKTDAELLTLLPPNPVLGEQPRLSIIPAIVDHTAHHRGALTIYARLNQLVPPDPYNS